MRILLFLICKLVGHKFYYKDEGHNPVYRREKCARCGYETRPYLYC